MDRSGGVKGVLGVSVGSIDDCSAEEHSSPVPAFSFAMGAGIGAGGVKGAVPELLKGTPLDPCFALPGRDDRNAGGGVPVGGLPGGEWSVAGDAVGDPGDAGVGAGVGAGAGVGDTGVGVAGSGVLAGELLAIAGRLAVAAVPDVPALCLDEAETLIRARDLVTSALAARVERVHVTGEVKAHGHASTGTWLRSSTPIPSSATTDPAATDPAATDPVTADPATGLANPDLLSPGAGATVADRTAGAPISNDAAGPGGGSVGRVGPGMGKAGAAQLMRMAVELARLPVIRERFALGLLPEGSVEAITAVTAKLGDEDAVRAEPIVAELAGSGSPAEIAKVGRYLRELLNPGTLDEECDDDYAARFLLLRQSRTGGVEGEFRLAREASAALVEFMTAYARPKDKDDDRPLRVRQADAFAALLTKKVSSELLVLVRAESMPDDVPAAPGMDDSSDIDPQQYGDAPWQDSDPQQDEDGPRQQDDSPWQGDGPRQQDDDGLRQETAHPARTPDEPTAATPDPAPSPTAGPRDDGAVTDNAVATGDPATEPGQPAKPAGPAKPTEPGQAVGPAKPIPTPALQPDTETHQPDPPRLPEEHSRQQAPPGGTSPPGHDHPQPDTGTRAGTGTGVGAGTRTGPCTDTGAGMGSGKHADRDAHAGTDAYAGASGSAGIGAGSGGRADRGTQADTRASADACRTCGHAPDRLAPGLLIATGHLLPISDIHRLARTSRLTRLVINAQGQVL
ncbi:hypothetical protein AB0B72_31895, partial [Microbispora sp. NPDC049125]